MEQPVYYWHPIIALSGMMCYTGDVFADWTGNILVGPLTPGLLVRLVMKDGRVAREERYVSDHNQRIRDVRQGPNGSVYPGFRSSKWHSDQAASPPLNQYTC